MAIKKEILNQIIMQAFPDAEINLIALVDDDNHYKVEIKSNMFKGKSRIEQHRMVNLALKDCLGTELHALQIHTKAKE